MAWYTYAYKAAFDPTTQQLAANATGEVFAVSDTQFTNPIPTFDLTGIPVVLTSTDLGFLPEFQVEDHVELLWKSGDYVFHLNTTTPLTGPEGAAVASAEVSGDALTFTLDNGEVLPPVTLPTGPGGSDEGVAGYIDSPDSETSQALARTLPGAVANALPIVAADSPTGGDDTTSLNAILAANAGKVVALKAGRTYTITDTLNIPSGTTLEGNGATIDVSGIRDGSGVRTGGIPDGAAQGERVAIKAAGAIGGSLTVSAPITKWSRTITGVSSTVGLDAGDLILISNDEPCVPGISNVRQDRDKGELNVVQSVSGTTVTLTTGALFDYGTASLKIQKITPVENLTIRNLKIQGGGVGAGHNGVEVRRARNVLIENVTVDGAEDIAIGLYMVWNGKVRASSITRASTPAYTTTGYGVAIMEASRHIQVEDNQFYHCRHFVAGGGYWPAAFVDVTGNRGEKSSNAAYDCHEPCFYWTFKRNTAIGVQSGFINRGQYVTIEDNDVEDSLSYAYEARTFDGATEQRGIRFINNRSSRNAYGLAIDGQAAGAEVASLKIGVEVVGNALTAAGAGADAILVRNFNGATVSGNKVTAPTRFGILCTGIDAANPSKNLTLNGNTVANAAEDAIQAKFVDDVSLTGGVITAPLKYGVDFITCNRTAITGTVIRNPVQSGIFLSGGAVHTVTGATVTGGVSGSYDALRGAGASDITVNGGYYAGPRSGVATTGGDRVIITGVNAMGSAGSKITSDATVKVLANNLV